MPSISLNSFSLSLSRPLETSEGTIDAREGVLVSVDRSGVRAVGEASPLPGWTESLAECKRALRRVIDATDTDAADIGDAEEADLEAALDALDPRETPAARHGLAMALTDRRARDAGRPLYRELGGEEDIERVPVNATIGDGTPDETARSATQAIDEDFRCLKVKVGARDVEADAARLRTIEEAVADTDAAIDTDVEVRADANGAWSRQEARTALGALEAVEADGRKEGPRTTRLAYVEQPLPADDLAGHAALRAESETPIALDESVSIHGIKEILDTGAADVLVCKPMVLGGLDRARRVALRARNAGIEPVVTTTIDGAVARAGATHLAASLAPIGACGLATADRLATDLVGTDPTSVTDSYARVPEGPGAFDGDLLSDALNEPRS
jgi:o-succinylbenzoate synthase